MAFDPSIEGEKMQHNSSVITRDAILYALEEGCYKQQISLAIIDYTKRLNNLIAPTSLLFETLINKLAAEELDPKCTTIHQKVNEYRREFPGDDALHLLTGLALGYLPGHIDDGSSTLLLQSLAYRIVELTPQAAAPSTAFENPLASNMQWSLKYRCQNPMCGRESVVGVSIGLSVSEVSSIAVNGPLAHVVQLPQSRLPKENSLMSALGLGGTTMVSNIADFAGHSHLQLTPVTPSQSLRRLHSSSKLRMPLRRVAPELSSPTSTQHLLPLPNFDPLLSLTAEALTLATTRQVSRI
ncbi:hypothetical protein DXG01_014474 [Tephrocybe rancida]|nr:hypothetical protein DXG01_014474 [Tephrocybe rancida]